MVTRWGSKRIYDVKCVEGSEIRIIYVSSDVLARSVLTLRRFTYVSSDVSGRSVFTM